MKVNILAGLARRACHRVRSADLVEVLAIRCRLCGAWVDPGDWDPQKAVCEACVRFVVRPVAKPRRSRRRWRTGGAR